MMMGRTDALQMVSTPIVANGFWTEERGLSKPIDTH